MITYLILLPFILILAISSNLAFKAATLKEKIPDKPVLIAERPFMTAQKVTSKSSNFGSNIHFKSV